MSFLNFNGLQFVIVACPGKIIVFQLSPDKTQLNFMFETPLTPQQVVTKIIKNNDSYLILALTSG
jgi:hypothetical protein